jgi:hypothetical protein
LIPKRLGLWYRFHVPTVFRFDGLRAMIYPNDHRPAYIHVMGGGREAIFNLRCPKGPPDLRENYGFGVNELNAYR